MKLVKNTIGHLLLDRIAKSPSKKAIGFFKDNKIINYNFKDYAKVVEALSLALLKKGVTNQDKVCILSQTRIEWNFLDLAILCSGAVTVPIYHTYLEDDVKYILQHSEAKMIIVEDSVQFSKLITVLDKLEDLVFIISIEKIESDLLKKLPSNIEYYNYEDFFDFGKNELQQNPDTFEIKINSLHDDNIATIVYTSGTTGKPKGAVIKQGALLQMLKNIKAFSNNALAENDKNLIFLPLSHVLGRCDSFLNLTFGCHSVYAEGADKIIENIKVSQPTFMIAVPRIFEKIYEKIKKNLKETTPLKRTLFSWAMKKADQYNKQIEDDKTPSSIDIIQYNVGQKLVTDKIYAMFGGKIRYFISGGAPLSEVIVNFMRNSNLTIVEGYGLTETIAPCVLNPFERQKPGKVGKPIGDVQIKFAHDGEILVKSKALFSHYYKDQKATDKAINPEGWFHTGDIGKFDNDGFLKITDRKKDIIITSGGKNIAPQKIENLLKLSENIEHCAIIGDKRKFLTALIIPPTQNSEKEKSDITSLIKTDIELVNTKLAKFETIKKFEILDIEVSTDNYLTPSLKLKKSVLLKDFKAKIDALYNN